MDTVGAVARGDNPPAGAILHFWLKDKPKAQPKLEILDADGKLVRSLGRPTDPEPTAVEKEGAAGKEPTGEEQEAKEKEAEEEEAEAGHGRPQEAQAARDAGPAPRGLGPGTRPRQTDQGSQDRFRQPRDRPAGPARKIHGEADGRRPDRHRTAGNLARSARQGSCRRAAEQVRLALAVRDDFNKLSGAVERLRTIRTQLQARNALIKDINQAKDTGEELDGPDFQARRAGGEAAQPQGPGHLRHPGHEGGCPALLQHWLALWLGAGRRRPAHQGHARRGRRD